MKVTFTTNDNSKMVVLPYITPDSFEINYGDKQNETFDSWKWGTIVALGAKPLTTISFSGTFPNTIESWMESDASSAIDYIHFFRDALKNNTILRIVATRDGKTDAIINMPCSIDAFTINSPAVNKDIDFTMTVTQYVRLTKKK